jgi:broad specificity phosphatase PhoE
MNLEDTWRYQLFLSKIMVKEVFILRHGETDLNKQQIVQGSGVDAPLNDTGLSQAASFYQKWQDFPFELVISSTLQRTHQTILPFIEKGIPHLATPNINEISWGDHEGKSSTPTMIQAYQEMIQAWADGDLDASLKNGESARQLIDRVDMFIDNMARLPQKKILICTHGRTIRCLITRLKQLPPVHMEHVSHSNTGLFRIQQQDQGWLFHLENDITHLQ